METRPGHSKVGCGGNEDKTGRIEKARTLHCKQKRARAGVEQTLQLWSLGQVFWLVFRFFEDSFSSPYPPLQLWSTFRYTMPDKC